MTLIIGQIDRRLRCNLTESAMIPTIATHSLNSKSFFAHIFLYPISYSRNMVSLFAFLLPEADFRVRLTPQTLQRLHAKDAPMKRATMKQAMIILIPTTVLAGAGFAYYALVGCSTGTCPITSSPIGSTLYGGLLGAVIGLNFFKGKKPEKTQEGNL